MNGKTKQMWSAESTGAVIRKCSVNNVFWIIGENSEENTCAWVSLKKFHVLRHATLLKSDSSKDVFTWILRSVKKTLFWEQIPQNQSGMSCIFYFLDAD